VGDRWEIARITGGYRATPRDSGGHTPIPRYGDPWCLISTDPADLWRELAPRTPQGADTQMPAARAPDRRDR
jgi:hypothetical protein